MKLTGRVRHRAAKEPMIAVGVRLVLQVEVISSKKSVEDFRKGFVTTEWIDASVEHLGEIDIRGELK